MPINSFISFSPVFDASFWQPYVPAAGTPDPAGPAPATATPRLCYSAQAHGSHADFQLSEDFAQYRNQVRENLSVLAAFCRQHRMPDAESIEHDLDVFFRHRFCEHHYFGARVEIADSIGKRSLDEFCSMIGNEAIDLEKRKTAIRTLSQGMTTDAESVVSNLAGAARVLAEAAGGLRGKLWALKEETASQVLSHVVRERFGREPDYPKNRVHYQRTAWNLLADHFGLKTVPATSMQLAAINRDSEFMSVCTARLGAALTPDRLCYRLAEACQAKFNREISTDSGKSFGIWDTHIANKAQQTLKEIAEGLGLATEDRLQFDHDKRDMVLKQSDLRLKSFLKLEGDDLAYAPTYSPLSFAPAYVFSPGPTYSLRTDPTLIALDILRAMGDLKLLVPESQPLSHGEWVEKDAIRAAIFTYGDLAWTARTPSRASFQGHGLGSKNVEFDLVTLPDLLLWKAYWRDEAPAPAAAVRQAIRATDPRQLEETRAYWLKDIEDIWQFLGGVGTDEARDYLVKSLTSLGAGYSHKERTDLLADLARIGIDDAVESLTRQWLSNSPTGSA